MMNQHFVLVLSAVQLILASGQADTELKSSCLLQTGAAREQPLAMNHGEDVVSRPEYLRNALVMVRELASNVTAWDTDLSQSERNSLDVIKQFITDLFQSAANSHDEDQREVNRARDLIGDCASTAKTSLTNDVQPLKNIMQGSRQDHNTCRTSEGGCQTHQNQACAEWEAYRKSNTPTECAGVAFKAHMGTQVESTKLDMEQCLRDLQPYYLKHIPCWQYKGCVDGFAPLCDNNQTKFERDFCGYSSQLSYTCQAQIDCRERHIKFRDDTHADVVVNEAARKADYTTGKKVLCYFKVFEAKNPNKSAILQGCDKLTVDTSKLDITYPGTPAPNPCVVEAEEPCTTGWVDAEYKSKKWLKDVTLTDCEPCPPPTTGVDEMDDDCSGWSANLHHIIDGKCYMGAFDSSNRRITKTFSGLQAGCTYKWKAVIDTWASVDNEKMILTVNGAATNFKTRGAGDCANGWTEYPNDFGDKVGSHGSATSWKDCWKNFEKEFIVPDSGNADVVMYFAIDQNIHDEGWGWHDMMFKKVSCPGGTPAPQTQEWVQQTNTQCGSTDAENAAAEAAIGRHNMHSPGRHDNSHLKDYGGQTKTLAQCQADCLANSMCRGIEFQSNSADPSQSSRCKLMYSGTNGGSYSGACWYIKKNGKVWKYV